MAYYFAGYIETRHHQTTQLTAVERGYISHLLFNNNTNSRSVQRVTNHILADSAKMAMNCSTTAGSDRNRGAGGGGRTKENNRKKEKKQIEE
jgi:hypothetical protein